MSSRPCTNSARLRHRESIEYASDTRAGSRLFQASSASRTFCDALSRVNGGNGGRAAWVMISVMCILFRGSRASSDDSALGRPRDRVYESQMSARRSLPEPRNFGRHDAVKQFLQPVGPNRSQRIAVGA